MPDTVDLDQYMQDNPDLVGAPIGTSESQQQGAPTWGDYGRALTAGAQDIDVGMNGISRLVREYLGDSEGADIAAARERAGERGLNETLSGMTDVGRQRLEQGLTTGEFWKHPLSAGALQIARLTPQLATALIPGAALGKMVGLGVFGAENAGTGIHNIRKVFDTLPDADLQDQSAVYRGLRTLYDEPEARRQYDIQMQSVYPIINAVVGAAAGELGPFGTLARGGVGGVVGRLAATGTGAIAGAAGMGAQNAVLDATTQSALVSGGLKQEFDPSEVARAALEGVATGGILGGATGLAVGGHGKVTPKGNTKGRGKATITNEIIDPDQTVAAAVNEAIKPTTSPEVPPEVAAASQRLGVDTPSAEPVSDIRAQLGSLGKGKDAVWLPAETVDHLEETGQLDDVMKQGVPIEDFDGKGGTLIAANSDVAARARSMRLAGGKDPQAMQQIVGQLTGDGAGKPAGTDTVVQQVTPQGNVTREQLVTPEQAPAVQQQMAAEPGKTAQITNTAEALARRQAKVEVEKAAAQDPYIAAREIIANGDGAVSPSKLQRQLNLKYPEVQALIRRLVADGVIEPSGEKGVQRYRRAGDAITQAAEDAKTLPEVATQTVDPDVAKTAAAVQEGADKGRVLLAQDAEAKANLKAQGDRVQQVAKAEEKAQAKAEGKKGPSHKSKAEQEAKAKLNADAAQLFNDVSQPDRSIAQSAQDLAGRKATQKYAKSIVAEATKRDIVIPDRPGKDEKATHTLWLAEARNLARRQRPPTRDEVVTFLTREKLLREGKAEEVRAERKVEGDLAKRQDQGNVEAPVGASAEALADRATPEQKLEAKEEGDHLPTDTREAEKEVYEAGRARQTVVTKDAVTVGTDKAGTFKVETKKRRGVGPKGEAALQKVRALDEPSEARASLGDVTAKVTTKIRNAFGRPAVLNQVRTVDGNHVDVRPLQTTDVRAFFKRVNPSGEGIGAKIHPLIRQIVLKGVGDMPVHVITAEDMKRVYGNDRPLGLYDPNNKRVFISERVFEQGDAKLQHVLTHEAIHALTSHALDFDEKSVRLTKSLMDEVLKHRPDLWTRYAFENEHEFLSEAMSNHQFQEELASISISPEAARELGIGDWRKFTMWTALVHTVRKILGLPRGATSALEAALAMTERTAYESGILPKDARAFRQRQELAAREMRPLVDRDYLQGKGEDVLTNLKVGTRALGDRLSSVWMLADRAKSVSPEFGELMNDLGTAKAKQVREAHKILEREGGLELTGEWAQYRREMGDEAYERAAKVGYDASNYNVNLGPNADNSHLGKDKMSGAQAKAKLPALQREFAALDPRGQELLQKTVEFYRAQHDEMAKSLVKNILELAGKYDPALADRVFKGTMTDADKAQFSEPVGNALEHATELRQMRGWFVPFRRFGDHVVSGHYELEAPQGSTKINDNTVQFVDPSGKGGFTAARREAKQFLESQDLRHTGTKKVYVDKNDPTKILEATDANAIPAFRVRFQTQHTEFHESPAEAQRAFERLQGEGLTKLHQGTRYNEGVANASFMSGELKTIVHSLEQQDRFKEMSKAEQDALRQALLESSIRVLGSTKVQSSFAQRRNVAGMDTDIGRVTADYARSSAGYISRLRLQPEIDKAFKALHEHVAQEKYVTPDKAKRRDELVNEITSRFKEDAFYQPTTRFQKASRRLLQISRLDKLAGVSFHVVNSMEPWTTSLPVIGGRHGFARATKAMIDAYSLIGGRGSALAGLADTARALKQDTGFTDYVDRMKHEIQNSVSLGGGRARRLQEALDYNNERGLFGDEAVFEVGRYADPTGNVVLRGLDRADLMANQMGRAVEAINRAVTSLAAYELEFKRTGNHEAAMRYSHQVTRDTMGDYARWNTPTVFNHPVGQLALQFRKFGLKTYYLLGKTFRGMLARDPEAAKQFLGLMVTHMVVAGALGLPLEPFKVGMTAANVLGLTGYDWDDVEHAVRAQAAAVLGVKGGEAFSHGLTRLIGIDLSSRMGLDSLMTFGRPRSNKPQDIKSFLFDTLAGAPAGYLLDQIRSAQALMSGDPVKAAELSIPIKGIADLIKAGEGLVPQQSQSGRETMRSFNPFEVAAQAAGFTPAVKVENYEKKSYAAQMLQRDKDARASLQHAWISAKPSEKADVWRRVQEFNRDRPPAERITMGQLNSALRRYKGNADTYEGGLRFTKRDQRLRESLSIYNAK
jgi:hypothetical protein